MFHEIILTFFSTHGAIAGEKALLNQNINVKVMPLPGAIQAGCGLCLRISPQDYARTLALLKACEIEIQNTYEACPGSGEYLPVYSEGIQSFTQAFGIFPGETVSIVGCGGKTSLLFLLSEENKQHPVLISTTTHIAIPEPDTISYYHKGTLITPIHPGIHLFYQSTGAGKINAVAEEEIKKLQPHFDFIFLECDGSRQMPLKGWASYEPVPVSFSNKTIGVCSIKAVGQTLTENICHRLPLFCETTGAQEGQPVTTAHLHAMTVHPQGMFQKEAGSKILFINQVETPSDIKAASTLASLVQKSNPEIAVFWGSIQNNKCEKWGEK